MKIDGRSLVVCLDGILIQARARISAFPVVRHPYFMRFPPQNSTVFEFYNQIKQSQQQLGYYDSEAGFYAGSSRLKKLSNSAIDAVLINV